MMMYNLLGYRSNYSDKRGSLCFCSKDEAANFDSNIANDHDFRSFKYKANIFWNTVIDGANGTLRNTTTSVPVNYLSNFLRSLEMPLTKCKAELKLRQTDHCVLSAANVDSAKVNSNNIVFTIKDTKFYVFVVTLSAKRRPAIIKTS